MLSYNFLWWCLQVYNEIKECEEKKFNFKIFKVMKSKSNAKISHYHLSNTFDDGFGNLILIFYIWVPNIKIESTLWKKIQFKHRWH